LSDFIQRNHYVDRQDFLPANINNFLTAPLPEESGMRFATRTWIRIDVHEVFKIVANHDIVAVEGGQSWIAALARWIRLIRIRVNHFKNDVILGRVHSVVNLAIRRHYHADLKRTVKIVNLAIEEALVLCSSGLIGTSCLTNEQYLHADIFVRIVTQLECRFM